MHCKVTQNRETLEIISTECTPAIGDTISIRYVTVYVSAGIAHPWLSGGVEFGGGTVGSTQPAGGGKSARARAAKKLRSTGMQKRIREAAKRMDKVDIPEEKVAKACDAAANAVERASILRDGKTDGIEVAVADLSALVAETFGHYQIYVDGDKTDVFDQEWEWNKASTVSEPGGTLANVLLHEGMHVCLELSGIGAVSLPGKNSPQHRYMQEVGVHPCASHVGQTCAPVDDGHHRVRPDLGSDALPDGSLERVARTRTLSKIPNGTLIQEPDGRRALVLNGHAFRITASPTPDQNAAISGAQPLPIWRNAIGDMSSIRDGLVVQVPGGPIVTIVGGAPMRVPDVEALKAAGWTDGETVIRRLWLGALEDLPTSPRDGTLIWEDDEADPLYVIYGGARFLVPKGKVAEYGLNRNRSRRLWPKATISFPTIPIDNTVFRTGPNELWIIRDRQRHRVADEQALAGLGIHPRNIRVIWPEALAHIPEPIPVCALEVVIERLSRSVFSAEDTTPTMVTYQVTNRGPATVTRIGLSRPFGPALSLARSIPAGVTVREQFRLDEHPIPPGKHTVHLRTHSSDCKSTGGVSAEMPFEVLPNNRPPPTGADLVPRAFWQSTIGNERTRVVAKSPFGPVVLWKLDNVGTATASTSVGHAVMRFELDGHPWDIGYQRARTPIAMGGTISGEVTLPTRLPIGPHKLRIIVDSIQGELNVDNNASTPALEFDVVER